MSRTKNRNNRVVKIIEEGRKGFEWPEFSKETERIKAITHIFRNDDIVEAFSQYYGLVINVSKDVDELTFDVSTLRPGMVIPLKIKTMDKRMTTFYNNSIKEEIVSAVNLYKYENFKHGILDVVIDCKVISMDLNKIVVDPFAPFYDLWLDKTLHNKDRQCNMNEDLSVEIKNLKLVNRGYNGDLILKDLSRFAGQDVCIKVFIPGSHIVLNIERDFERWNGKSVRAFLSNYMSDAANSGQMSLIYSVKDYLKFQGDKFIVNTFKEWTEDSEKWKQITETKYIGKVTGVINSSKKCGVFVEVPSLNITGMVSKTPTELVNYKPGDEIKIKIANFEEQMYYDKTIGQMRHAEPYIVKDGILKRCNVKIILEEI